MGLLSLDTLVKLLFFPCQPASVTPLCPLAAPLTQSPSQGVYAAVPGNSYSISLESQCTRALLLLLPHPHRAELCIVSAQRHTTAHLPGTSSSYTNNRIYHLFEIMQQCLAPCFLCKDSAPVSRRLWRDKLRQFQMDMISGEKSRVPGRHSVVQVAAPWLHLPCPFCSLQAMGRVGRGQGTDHFSAADAIIASALEAIAFLHTCAQPRGGLQESGTHGVREGAVECTRHSTGLLAMVLTCPDRSQDHALLHP